MLQQAVEIVLAFLGIPAPIAIRSIVIAILKVYLLLMIITNISTIAWFLTGLAWALLQKITLTDFFGTNVVHYAREAADIVKEAWVESRPAVESAKVEVPKASLEWYAGIVSLVLGFSYLQLAGIFMIATVVILMAWNFRRVSYAVRGIRYEAMQPGSEFRSGDIPKFQIPVYASGLLYSRFQGYAVRVGNALVCPTHVLNQCEQVLVGKFLISGWEQSVKLADVSYALVSEKVFSQLGMAKPSIGKLNGKNLVFCTGVNGTSSGTLTKINTIGMVSYSGSTLPGYSGAAYCDKNTLFGIHTGNSGNGINVGVSAFFLECEINCKWPSYVGESYGAYHEEGGTNDLLSKKQIRRGNRVGWDNANILKEMKSAYEQGSIYKSPYEEITEDMMTRAGAWAMEFEGADNKAEVNEILSEMTESQRKAMLRALVGQVTVDKVSYNGQTSNGGEVVQDVTVTLEYALLKEEITANAESARQREALLLDKVNECVTLTNEALTVAKQAMTAVEAVFPLNDRVNLLERDLLKVKELTNTRDKILEMEQQSHDVQVVVNPTPEISFPCEKCNRKFKSKMALMMHNVNKHEEVQGESATADNVTRIQTRRGPFLGQKKSLRSKPMKLEREQPQFSLMLENQLKTQIMLERLVNCLESKVPESAGHILEKQQN